MDTQPLWLKGHMGTTGIPGENNERAGQPGLNPGLLSVGCLLTKELRSKVRGVAKANVTKEAKYVLILEKIGSHRFQSKEVTDQSLSLGQSLCWPETETLEAKGQIRRHCNGSDKR